MTVTLDQLLADPVKIVLAVVLVELIVLVLVRQRIAGQVILEWYKEFRLGAFLSDVSSALFGVLLALCLFQYVFPREWFSLPHFLLCVVAIQMTHDLAFGALLRHFPNKQNAMMDMFKRYVDENSWKILVVDAMIMIGCVVMLYLVIPMKKEMVWCALAFALYLCQYLIYG